MIATAKFDIEKVVQTELPPLPGAAMRVASLTQDVNASTRAIADALGADPVLAARVLRAANSPMYSLERRVTALPMAVNALGNHTLNLLSVVSATADALKDKKFQTALMKKLWIHSLAVGVAARALIRELKLNGGEEAFICGLLHDIGKLILNSCDAELYASCASCEDEQGMLDREREIFGYTHAQVGALVAKRWNFPDEISYAIYNHHHPGESKGSVVISRVIDVADSLAISHGFGLRGPADTIPAFTESGIALRLGTEQLDEVWAKIEPELNEMLSVFS
ncbi:MAG: HDOD domain-containing protein [Pyrinomonadaceae bacterium]